MSEEELAEDVPLTSAEQCSYRDEDARPFITRNRGTGAIKYWVSVDVGYEVRNGVTRPKRDEFEIDRETYRDVIATSHLALRDEIFAVLGSFDIAAFGEWINRVSTEKY